MRLICPKCQAQYEIDGSLIPAKGRQVQCSSCGNTWLQKPDAAGSAAAAKGAGAASPEATAGAAPDSGDGAAGSGAVRAVGSAAEPNAPTKASAEAPARKTPAEAQAGREPQRRQIDPSVLAVLRDEAAREAGARRPHRSPGDETGLSRLHPNPVRENVAAATREAKAEKRPAAQQPTRPASFRPDQGPDPEAVGKRLRGIVERESNARAAAEAERTGRRRRAGFRTGFVLAALISAAAIAAYVAAPEIVARTTGAEAALAEYVAAVDAARDWVDRTVDRLLAELDGLIGTATP